jgi:hypothetical protein
MVTIHNYVPHNVLSFLWSKGHISIYYYNKHVFFWFKLLNYFSVAHLQNITITWTTITKTLAHKISFIIYSTYIFIQHAFCWSTHVHYSKFCYILQKSHLHPKRTSNCIPDYMKTLCEPPSSTCSSSYQWWPWDGCSGVCCKSQASDGLCGVCVCVCVCMWKTWTKSFHLQYFSKLGHRKNVAQSL